MSAIARYAGAMAAAQLPDARRSAIRERGAATAQRTPNRQRFALILSSRDYNLDLLASVVLELGLASLERPAAASAVRLVDGIRPEYVFVVADPARIEDRVLVAEIAARGARLVVAVIPPGCTDEQTLRAAGAHACIRESDAPETALSVVHAADRRVGREAEARSLLHVGDLAADRATRTIHAGATVIHLTPVEYRLLVTLMEKADHVVDPEELMERALGRGVSAAGARELLKTHVSRLRTRLRQEGIGSAIQTVRGFGYMLLSQRCIVQDDGYPVRSASTPSANDDWSI